MSGRDFIVVLLACVIWALNSVMSKLVISSLGVPPLAYTTARFLVVMAVTAPWLLPAPRPTWRLIAVGLLMGAASFGLSFIGLKTAHPSDLAILGQLGVPFSTVFSMLLLGERVRWRRGLGILLTLSGVTFIVWTPHGLSGTVGTWFIIGSTLSGALGAVLMKQFEGVRPLQFQAWVSWASAPPLAAASALFETGQFDALGRTPLLVIGAVLFSGLIVSVVAHTLYYDLIQRYDVNLLQPVLMLSPVLTIVAGVLITHDPFSVRTAIGAAVTLTGVLIVALRPNIASPRLLLDRLREQ